MGTVGRVPKIKDGDWTSVRQAIQKLSIKTGPASEPTYAGLNLIANGATLLFNWTDSGSYGELAFKESSTYIGFVGGYGTTYGGIDSGQLIFTSALNNDGGIVFKTKTNNNFYSRMQILNNGDVIVNSLSASKLVATDADKALVSSDLASWVTQTANQVLVADDGDGTITLSTPQDIHTGASPTFSTINATSKFKLGGGARIEYDSESSNIPLRLADAAGASYVSVEDSNSAEQARITSDGEFWSTIWNTHTGGVIYVDSDGHLDADHDVFDWDGTRLLTGKIQTSGDIGVLVDTDLLQLSANLLTVNGAITATGIITGAEVNIGSTGPTDCKLAVGTADTGNYAGLVGIYSTSGSPTSTNLNAGLSIEPYWADAAGLNRYGAIIYPKIGGTTGTAYVWGLFGGIISEGVITNKTTFLLALDFDAKHTASFIGGAFFNTSYNIYGLRVCGRLGYEATTISNKVNASAYGGELRARLDGTFNSTGADGNAYGAYIATQDDGIDSTIDNRNVNVYGLYIDACAGKAFTGGGGVAGNLVSWGLYEANGRNNFLKGKLGFAQTDLNEFVGSLNDGYMDYGATTAHRFDNIIESPKSKLTAIGGYAVKLTNETGANSVAGQVVVADDTTDDAVDLHTAGDVNPIGVFLDGGIADGSEAWIIISGIADVMMEDNVASVRGQWIGASTSENGVAEISASPPAAPTHFNEMGHCVETVAAGGGGTHILARCVLHFN